LGADIQKRSVLPHVEFVQPGHLEKNRILEGIGSPLATGNGEISTRIFM
jgi:hypothetical protein